MTNSHSHNNGNDSQSQPPTSEPAPDFTAASILEMKHRRVETGRPVTALRITIDEAADLSNEFHAAGTLPADGSERTFVATGDHIYGVAIVTVPPSFIDRSGRWELP